MMFQKLDQPKSIRLTPKLILFDQLGFAYKVKLEGVGQSKLIEEP